MELLSAFVHRIVFAEPMMLLVLGLGLWLSIRLGFVQFGRLGVVIAETIGAIRERSEKFGGVISPFQAALVALSGSLGVGQIVGVVGAILTGGPGAILWMWLFYVLAMVFKFAEATLAVHFRVESKNRHLMGGVMVYIRRGLSAQWAWLGILSAGLVVLSSFAIGNFAQASVVGTAFLQEYRISPALVGLLMGVVVGAVLVGGLQRVAQLTQILVPVKLGLLALALLPLFFAHLSSLPQAFLAIFAHALGFKAAASGALGGAVALGFWETLKSGVGRGIFVSEAGLGVSSIAHAQAQVDHPVRQGFWGIAEMLVSLVFSSLVALSFLSSGLWRKFLEHDKIETTRIWFASHPLGVPMLILLLVFLALGTMLSWSFYGEEASVFLLGEVVRLPFRLTFATVVFMGSLVTSSKSLNLWVENLMGLLSLPNLWALVVLVGVVGTLLHEFFAGLPWNQPPKENET